MANELDDLKLKRIRNANKAKREAHADVQFNFRAKMAARNSPDREDFGRAALGVFLQLCANIENREFTDALKRSILSRLRYVGFDGAEVEKKFYKMLDRSSDDIEAWKRHKDWQRLKMSKEAEA